MKSIRVSLIVYFLVLLAVALGAASFLVYRTAAESLRVKQEVHRELLETQHRQSLDKINRAFDDELLHMARDVARSAVTRYHWDRLNYTRLMPLGLMNEMNAHAFAWAWAAEYAATPPGWPGSQPGSLSSLVAWYIGQDLTPDEDDLPHDESSPVYFQINSSWGLRWQSPSLGGHYLDYDPTEFINEDLLTWRSDDFQSPVTGQSVHRVMLKYPARRRPPPRLTIRRELVGPPAPDRRPPGEQLSGARSLGDPRSGRGSRPSGDQRSGRGSRSPSDPRPGSSLVNRTGDPGIPWIVVHCAMEPTRRDRAIDDLNAKKLADLEELQASAQETLASLRWRLLWIGLCTFAATTLGGSLLVSMGLAPLRRLTEAVSRVSPKDFRLPITTDEPLPIELDPIRGRLQHTLSELHKAFEREKQASADISHELRTPVASLLTAVEVALRKPRSAEEYRQTLEDCRLTARQMRQLVERIMALSRLDAGSDRIRPCEVDVGELVAECAALVRPLAGERGLELRVHCPKPVTWTTDPDKLREVLINLLHNAIQYNRPDGAIDVSAQADGRWLDVQVHDTGIGIAPEAFEHIFERFYRSDPSRSGSELHAGLGLSIVKGYVDLLGGTVSVESRVGQGSTFRVRLPATDQAA
jgi:signal transduction histidine kinase